jgi:L-lactate dehydrogenase complex protein LldF
MDKSTFREASELSFDEEHWQKINYNTSCYEKNFSKGKVNYRNMELEKERAYNLSNKSLMNLEKLLVDFETHFNENGGKVLWARDAEDARKLIFDLLTREKVNTVSRSNSTVLDEIDLNAFLGRKNIRVVETNIARFSLKIKDMQAYHPLLPAIHLSKEEINGLLNGKYKLKTESSPKQIVNFVRHQVSQESVGVQACLTGANFLLSDEGGVVLTENEGNILKATSSAKIHIVVAGIAKVVSSIDDLSVLLPLLSSHATGQGLAAFNTISFGPAKNGNNPKQMYVILLNNDRSELLSHEKQRKVLSCIHCSACVSVCPVYKNIGGYAYDSSHVGPMGIVMTPLMRGLKEYEYLTSACSLCGKCTEICPVKIPLDDLLIENRHLIATEKVGDAKLESMFKLMIWHCKSRKKMDSPLFMKKIELKRFLNRQTWGERREVPELAPKSFSQWWKERKS